MFAHDSIHAFLRVVFPAGFRRRRVRSGKSFQSWPLARGNEAKKQRM